MSEFKKMVTEVRDAVETGVWDRDSLRALLMTNQRAVERALVVVYGFQTADEQAIEQTTDANGVGFSAFDAEIFSSFAKRILSGKSLTEKQVAVCRKGKNPRIAKYWKQLLVGIEARQPAQKELVV